MITMVEYMQEKDRMIKRLEGTELALGRLRAVSRLQRVLFRGYEYKICPGYAWLVLSTRT